MGGKGNPQMQNIYKTPPVLFPHLKKDLLHFPLQWGLAFCSSCFSAFVISAVSSGRSESSTSSPRAASCTRTCTSPPLPCKNVYGSLSKWSSLICSVHVQAALWLFSLDLYVRCVCCRWCHQDMINMFIRACWSRQGSTPWTVASTFGTKMTLLPAKYPPLRVLPLHPHHGICGRSSRHAHWGSDRAPQLCLRTPSTSLHIPSCPPASCARNCLSQLVIFS